MTTLQLETAYACAGVDHILSWKTLPSLLENASKLEALVYDQVIWDNISEDNDFLFLEVFPICFVEHLKEIEVKLFCNRSYEFKLVEYLLNNGKALKKMAVGLFLKPAVCKRILSFRRCSEDCQIVLYKIRGNENSMSGNVTKSRQRIFPFFEN